MMADIRIRKIDDWVIAVHRRLAMNNGDSLESHFRKLLFEAAIEPQNRFADRVEKRLKEMQARHRLLPDGTELIREERG